MGRRAGGQERNIDGRIYGAEARNGWGMCRPEYLCRLVLGCVHMGMLRRLIDDFVLDRDRGCERGACLRTNIITLSGRGNLLLRIARICWYLDNYYGQYRGILRKFRIVAETEQMAKAKGDMGFGAESTGTEVAGRFRGVIWGRTCEYFCFSLVLCYWWCLLCLFLCLSCVWFWASAGYLSDVGG